MSRNFSPNLIVIKILEKINILILLYKTLLESFGYCVRDWYDFPHKAILVFLRVLCKWTIFNARRLIHNGMVSMQDPWTFGDQ